ncbi:MAG: DUF2807 domain-containing protein [bacterium]|nr:DUF2807 domain-containing protein [bacterium]
MRRKSVLAAFGLLFFASQILISQAHAGSWWGNTEKGSGDLETVSFDLDSFSRIKAQGSSDIYIKIGREQSVELTCDDNLIDNMIIKVRGKSLIIDSEGSFSTRKGPRIDITVPSLESMSLSGSGDVEIEGLNGGEFDYRLSGSGDLRAEGKLEFLEIKLTGSGDIDTRDLIAEEVDCRLSGSGDIQVYASESFDGSVSGSGDITYYGKPKHVDRSVSGSGSIRKR